MNSRQCTRIENLSAAKHAKGAKENQDQKFTAECAENAEFLREFSENLSI
jgi:hypothetical protein